VTRLQKITFGEMREMDVRRLLAPRWCCRSKASVWGLGVVLLF
jgi:hypothetical protein